MAGIPPGPQSPFSKDRTDGQQPGFVSRHSGKIIVGLILLVVVLLVSVLIALSNERNDDAEQVRAPVEITNNSLRSV